MIISLLNLCHLSNFYVTMLMKIDRVKIVEFLMTWRPSSHYRPTATEGKHGTAEYPPALKQGYVKELLKPRKTKIITTFAGKVYSSPWQFWQNNSRSGRTGKVRPVECWKNHCIHLKRHPDVTGYSLEETQLIFLVDDHSKMQNSKNLHHRQKNDVLPMAVSWEMAGRMRGRTDFRFS